MKTSGGGALTLIFLSLISSVPTVITPIAAQTTGGEPDAPDAAVVSVLKSSWSKERINWERDPFSGPVENYDEMRVRTRNEKRIEEAKKGGNQSEASRLEREARADAAIFARQRQKAPPRYVFVYKASVKNMGAKPIKAIDWDYVFLDAGDAVAPHREAGRLQFTSEEKIAPGKSKELMVMAPFPPTRTISVYELNRKEREGITAHVVIMRVVFSDNSVWQRR